MLAIKGIYDGKTIIPVQPVSITGQHEVIITFLEQTWTQATSPVQIDWLDDFFMLGDKANGNSGDQKWTRDEIHGRR